MLSFISKYLYLSTILAYFPIKCLAVNSKISSALSKSFSESTGWSRQWYLISRMQASFLSRNGVCMSGFIAPFWSRFNWVSILQNMLRIRADILKTTKNPMQKEILMKAKTVKRTYKCAFFARDWNCCCCCWCCNCCCCCCWTPGWGRACGALNLWFITWFGWFWWFAGTWFWWCWAGCPAIGWFDMGCVWMEWLWSPVWLWCWLVWLVCWWVWWEWVRGWGCGWWCTVCVAECSLDGTETDILGTVCACVVTGWNKVRLSVRKLCVVESFTFSSHR